MPVEGAEWDEVAKIYEMICEQVCREGEDAPDAEQSAED